MNTLTYLLQASACVGIFFLLYHLFLNRLTFFTINRWYLVSTLILSFVIPLITITVHHETIPTLQEVKYFGQLKNLPVKLPVMNIQPLALVSDISISRITIFAYFMVTFALGLRLIILVYVFFLNVLNQKSTAVGRIHVIRGNHRLGNSSFLNYIFLKDEMLGNEKMEQILQHELLHVKWLHSIDLLIFELAKIILWFNPFIYLYSRAVKENHEFEVDHEIGRIADKKEYADLILQLCIGKEKPLFHTFSKMPLEKRINMLFSQPTNNLKKLIYLLILPSFGLSCLAFADFRVTNDVLKISPQDVHSNNQIIGRQDKKTDLKSVIIPEVHNIQTDIIFKNSIREQKKERNFTEDPKSNQSAENSETSTLATSFFSREHVENSDGKNIDKITFQLFNGSASAVLGKDDKLGAFIDGHFYDEDAIRKLPSSKTALLIFDRSENVAKTDNIPEGNFAIPFSFKTKAVMTERY